MSVLIVDKGLEISNFNYFAAPTPILNERIQLYWVFAVLSEQLLDLFVVQEFSLAQAKDFERLLLCNEATLDSESFLGHLLSATVAKLLHVHFIPLLL